MARARTRLFVILAAVFIGLYVISQNVYFGQWYYLGHISPVKWLLLGLGLWIIVGCLSARPRRRYYYDDYRRRRGSVGDRNVQDRIDRLQKEVTELRYRRERSSSPAHDSDLDAKLTDLTERIITLEKIVTDRRYRLDEEFDKL